MAAIDELSTGGYSDRAGSGQSDRTYPQRGLTPATQRERCPGAAVTANSAGDVAIAGEFGGSISFGGKTLVSPGDARHVRGSLQR